MPIDLILNGITYKNPTKVLSVEMEAALKAGHCVDPEREMQFCAIAPGAAARIDSRVVLVLGPIDLCFRLLDFVCPRLAIGRSRDDADDPSTSTRLAWSIGSVLSMVVVV